MAVGEIHPDARFHDAIGWYFPARPKEEDRTSWGDKADQFTARVHDAHPVISKDADRHARYALAMEMIHSRQSKYALVDLVNWLLTKWPELQSEAKR